MEYHKTLNYFKICTVYLCLSIALLLGCFGSSRGIHYVDSKRQKSLTQSRGIYPRRIVFTFWSLIFRSIVYKIPRLVPNLTHPIHPILMIRCNIFLQFMPQFSKHFHTKQQKYL